MSSNPYKVHSAIGQQAEELACRYLRGKQYDILARNWHRSWGEIDIVARTNGVICFVEVKGESSSRAGFEAWRRAGHHKLTKVARTARTWLTHHGMADIPWRLDIIQVSIRRASDDAHITHFKNVLL